MLFLRSGVYMFHALNGDKVVSRGVKVPDSLASKAVRYPVSQMSFFQKPSLAYLDMDQVDPRDSLEILELMSRLGKDDSTGPSEEYSSSLSSGTGTLVSGSVGSNYGHSYTRGGQESNRSTQPFVTIKLGRKQPRPQDHSPNPIPHCAPQKSTKKYTQASPSLSSHSSSRPNQSTRGDLDLTRPLEELERGLVSHQPMRSRFRSDFAPSGFSPRISAMKSSQSSGKHNPFAIRLKPSGKKFQLPVPDSSSNSSQPLHLTPPLTPVSEGRSSQPGGGGRKTPPYLSRTAHQRQDSHGSNSGYEELRTPDSSTGEPSSFSRSNTSRSQTSCSSSEEQDSSRIPTNRRMRRKAATKERIHTLDGLLSDIMVELQTLKTNSVHSLPEFCKTGAQGELPIPECFICKGKIMSTPVTLPENPQSIFYHRTCLRCNHCHVPINSSHQYHCVEGQLYCSQHNPNQPKLLCAGCNDPVDLQSSLFALNRHWHPEHLMCVVCKMPAPADKPRDLLEHQGRVYCREDYTRLYIPHCQGCTKPIFGNALFALNSKWHSECFNCQVCHREFPDKSFYVLNNKPHCRYHYHQLNKSLCQACQEPIEGPCAQVTEGRFHPSCFVCRCCRTPLRDVYYTVQGVFYCEQHLHQAHTSTGSNQIKRQRTLMRNL
ncbi:hypothetical protein IWQ61_004207 [Dispira simplex]|nr:hypothetical protein IWQ61_004207 [Dispira simplex]